MATAYWEREVNLFINHATGNSSYLFFFLDKGNSSYLKGLFGTAKSGWTVWTVIVQLLERLIIAIIEAVTIAFLYF